MEHYDQIIRNVSDGAIGTATVTAPVWMQHLQTDTALFMSLGGVLLLAIRLAIAIREWRRGRKK